MKLWPSYLVTNSFYSIYSVRNRQSIRQVRRGQNRSRHNQSENANGTVSDNFFLANWAPRDFPSIAPRDSSKRFLVSATGMQPMCHTARHTYFFMLRQTFRLSSSSTVFDPMITLGVLQYACRSIVSNCWTEISPRCCTGRIGALHQIVGRPCGKSATTTTPYVSSFS